MKKYKSWAVKFLIALIFVVSPLSGVQADDQNTLLVGVNPEYTPLIYKENGKLTGIDHATALEVGKSLHKEVVFKEYPWNELIPALENGDIDVIMSGMSITDARAERVNFSHPYLEIGQMAIIRTADTGRLNYPGSMLKSGVAVGVEADTTGADFAREYLIEAEIKPYTNTVEAFAALRAKEIDFFIHDAPTSWNLAQSKDTSDLMALYTPLTNESLAWAVNKNNDALLAELNNALIALARAGIIRQIQSHWIPVRIEVN